LVVIAPGVSAVVAKALAEVWERLGPSNVQVVLDVDPEVCRIGYGEFEAVKILQAVAGRLGTAVHSQSGLRIGVVVTDETTLVYSPTPLLIESKIEDSRRSNAIRIDTPLADPDETPLAIEQNLGLESRPVAENQVREAEQDLTTNPPVKFDLAQKVRVFNTCLEFVEFELRGHRISQRRVPIPSDLMGLAKDQRAQKLLRSSFRLVPEKSKISGEKVDRLKQWISNNYLTTWSGYGNVILRTRKAAFERAVRTLDRYIKRFQRRLMESLQSDIDQNRELLVSALLPSVAANPPQRWIRKFLGPKPWKEREVESLLRSELKKAFGSAKDVMQEMKLKVVFKGVTYESLVDPEFVRLVEQAFPNLRTPFEEYDAAKATGGLFGTGR